MVEIRYKDCYEVADLAGQKVSEAREQFKTEFGIPNEARAQLNGRKVKESSESDIVLKDDDKLSFTVARSRGAYMVGVLLLALVATSGVFAFGWSNPTASFGNVSVNAYDFASVSENTAAKTEISWHGYGFYRGTIDAGAYPGKGIFDIDTKSSGYTGDLVVTVSIANTGELAKVYRVLSLELDMTYPDGSPTDINGDGVASSTTDVALLTLANGSVDLFYGGTANVCTVRIKSGTLPAA